MKIYYDNFLYGTKFSYKLSNNVNTKMAYVHLLN